MNGFFKHAILLFIMSIFLLTAVPLVFFLFITLEFRGLTATKTFKSAFVSGFVLSALSLLILAVMSYYIQNRYTRLMVFICHWFFDILYYTLFSVGGYFVLSARRFFVFDDRKDFPFLYAYFSGYLTPVGFYTVMRNFYTLDSYILFLFPMILIAVGFWLSFLIIEGQRQRGYLRVIIFLTILPLTLTAALVPWLYYLNYQMYALLLDIFILLVCSSIYSILRHDYTKIFGS